MNTLLRFSSIDAVVPNRVYDEKDLKPEKKIGLLSFASYHAMFKQDVPCFLIEKYTKVGGVVYDPFSGRGTTLIQARSLNRTAFASDLNPYAFVISKAKAIYINKEKILACLKKWKQQFRKNIEKWKIAILKKEFAELHYFYSKKTLAQLLFLRYTYGKRWKLLDDNYTFLLALTLGIMHGPTRKNGTTIYFSVSMPNTISMAPNYVKNYVIKHNLSIPEVDIFENIKNRFEKYYKLHLNEEKIGKVFLHDATKKVSKKHIADQSIDLVVTSPPYLNVFDYTNSNWLKLWLLGYERKKLRQEIKLSDNLNYEQYKPFITKFLNNIHIKLKPMAHLCLIVGDVHKKELIKKIWNDIKNIVPFRFVEIYNYENIKNKKVTNILNKRAGKATKIDKFLVLQRK